MSFKQLKDFCVRKRVHLGYPVFLVGAFLIPGCSRTLILIGCVYVALGLLIRSWSAGYIHKSTELCTTGPYSWLRHPLYLSNALIFFGFAVAITHFDKPAISLILWCLVGAYFTIVYKWRIEFEEKKLSEIFTSAWAAYVQEVPRLIPRIPKNQKSTDSHFSWNQWLLNKEYRALIAASITLTIILFLSHGS